MSITIYWLIIFVILVVIEIMTMGLTTIWFAGGSLVAALAAAVGLPWYVQIVLFLLVSIIMLIFTRPIALKYFNKDRIKTNAEGLVGRQAIVLQEINNLKGIGQVTVNGQEWTARTVDNLQTVEVGAVVQICGIEGVKLIVSQIAMNPQPQQPNFVQPGAQVVELSNTQPNGQAYSQPNQ